MKNHPHTESEPRSWRYPSLSSEPISVRFPVSPERAATDEILRGVNERSPRPILPRATLNT